MDPRIEDAIIAEARALGFAAAGIADVRPSDHRDAYERWIAAGHHGEMGYLAREDARARRYDLTRTLEGVRAAVVVAHDYGDPDREAEPAGPDRGVIARYARGRDYHKVVPPRLKRLHRWIEARVGHAVPGRVYVDTGPLLERELALRAGLGWVGRNTMLIHPRRGSYFFLGVLLLGLDLEPTGTAVRDHCGTCRACLDGCPTGALLGRDAEGAPVMDARRCISYLTIEHRGPIPVELRPLIGNRIYGCDICQEVCPFTQRFAEAPTEPAYAARGPGERPVGVEALPGEATPSLRGRPDVPAETPGRVHAHPGTDAPLLVELMRMTRDEWDAFTRGSAIRRVGFAGFRRNVAVAMGNWLASADEPPSEAVAVLQDALEDEEPVVREHAAWALGGAEDN
ncbi:MAG: tRNA epoxyqueuosine(34) reductase QueG [Gemmatimonadetes bacterium]|nr:tRNA epoxyqueuosine(34) reductase QueG [Gemmatimonadota bacterium]